MHHIHVCLLFLENECIGPWRKGSYTGHQSLDIFQIFWKPNCAKIGKKSFKFGTLLLLYIQGENVSFSKILPDCPRKKTFALCGHDWEHM